MKSFFRVTTALAVLTLAGTAACAGGGQVVGGDSADGTFTLGISSDPGGLDPQRSNDGVNEQVAALAYDTPVTLSKNDQLQPGIVTAWQNLDPTTWVLTVRDGVTCSDGSAMDGKTVADNLNYVADAKNSNPYAGLTIPAGSVATANGNSVTVKLPAPTSFLMQDLALLPLACEKGLTNRASLATTSDGTGPYVISSVVPGDHISYTLRKGYTWGPPGATGSSASGLPAKVDIKIVTSATTTANLLLNGQLNAANVTGTDQKRLQGSGLYSAGLSYLSDQVFFNHSSGLPTADANVRKSLVMGLDMEQVIAADTGGLGTPATGLLGTPKVCPGNTLAGSLPAFNVNGAQALLTQAGWIGQSGGTRTKAGQSLTIPLAYASDQTGASNAAQVIAAAWRQIGVNVTLVGQPAQQLVSGILGATLGWDAAVFAVGVATPAQMMPFVSGSVAPQGENFSFIDNPTYNELVAKAAAQPGTQGCQNWNAAESALFGNADVAPTGQTPSLYYGKNATFEVSGNDLILPSTIRMH